jgi:hypothetical protein
MAPALRFAAVVASVVVAVGFLMFAVDETSSGSQTQQAKLGDALNDPTPAPTRAPDQDRGHGPVRRAVDDANHYLLAPFNGVVSSRNAWVSHGVPALLGLLFYGVGLTMLANVLPKPRAHGGDWRAA